MEEPEDAQDLSSLDADDDFERRMIQNARDERRLKDALNGSARVQAFRKARAPRLGLTVDNVERSNARNHGALEADAHVKFESPPSSSGSTRSDPAIHAPAGWGRKSRSNRNWMRTITYEEQLQTTPPPADDTANGLQDDQYQQEGDENHPRRSIEDSPLSHKGTPRNDRSAEWDLTFELNEASMIASTPYIPRNTMLDDIRQREVESLARVRVPENSAQETRRSQLLSKTDDANATEPAAISPGKRLRTSSWQSIGKSQPVTGTGKENSPVAIYKTSTETVSVWEQDIPADTRRGPSRPVRHRREDSQDLLRRLARVSNTPSPRRFEPPRPQTAPESQLRGSSKTTARDEPQPPASTENIAPEVVESPLPEVSSTAATGAPATRSQQEEPKESPAEPEAQEERAPKKEPEDVDATPMPSGRTRLDPKTPVVTGAWVDTPGPRTTHKHIGIARSPSLSPKKGSPRKNKSPVKSTASKVDGVVAETVAEAVRPQLPSSALQALVQEAKANGRRQAADFGDSTINSLEDLISPEGDIDEDTLQGLQLPTITPRNEAERQRQQELQHLHRMNDRLRAARTSIRDASRGMKRVEDRVEHGEEVEGGAKAVLRECPCSVEGHPFSIRSSLKSLFWDTTLKTNRQGTSWRTLGGLTTLSILMLLLFTWWISEEIACELYCHHPYTNFSPYKYSVNPNAPQFPFVIPTLVWRALFWWIPAGSAASWIGRSIFTAHDAAAMRQSASSTAAWAASSQIAEEVVWEQSMLRDEVI